MDKTGEKGLETLLVWQSSLAFVAEICQNVLPLFPTQERWSLTRQLRRSVQSIPANIPEGYRRCYFQEAVRSCYVARGSLEQTFSHLALARQPGYLDAQRYEQLVQDLATIRKMFNGYIAFLKQSKRGATEPGADQDIREAPALYLPTAETSDSDFTDSGSPVLQITYSPNCLSAY